MLAAPPLAHLDKNVIGHILRVVRAAAADAGAVLELERVTHRHGVGPNAQSRDTLLRNLFRSHVIHDLEIGFVVT